VCESRESDKLGDFDLRCKIELVARVPTATLGNSGVKRKKLRGLMTVTLYSDVSRLLRNAVEAHPLPTTTTFFFEGSNGSCGPGFRSFWVI
jgi:hypothetical protein